MAKKKIVLNSGIKQKVYYLWDEFRTREECLKIGKMIKEERKNEFRIRWFIIEVEEGTFIKNKCFQLYLNKDLKWF